MYTRYKIISVYKGVMGRSYLWSFTTVCISTINQTNQINKTSGMVIAPPLGWTIKKKIIQFVLYKRFINFKLYQIQNKCSLVPMPVFSFFPPSKLAF